MHMGSNERGAYYDKTGKGQRYLSDAVVDAQKNWPTVCASEVRQGFQDRSRGMKGSQESLTTAVVKDAANWPTPNCMDVITPTRDLTQMESKGHWGKSMNTGKLSEMVNYGLPAPANPSTDGSRQGLSEQSQRNWQTFAHGTHNRGETPHRQVVKALVNGEKAQTQCLTVDQVFAEEIKGTNPKMWRTPSVAEEKNQNTSTQIYLQNQVGATPKAWATPATRDTQGPRGKAAQERKGNPMDTLPNQLMTTGGKLNPRWVETLMGLPIGWTMPSCTRPVTIEPMNCDCLETESSQPPQNEHLELF
jgi:hypothetical protein